MLKIAFILSILVAAFCALGQNDNHDKNTVRHAVKHAAHWVNHHVSAPHKVHHHYPRRGHKDRSTHHAAMHAEHWLNNHLKSPKDKTGH